MYGDVERCYSWLNEWGVGKGVGGETGRICSLGPQIFNFLVLGTLCVRTIDLEIKNQIRPYILAAGTNHLAA